jgi:hypothetical protein
VASGAYLDETTKYSIANLSGASGNNAVASRILAKNNPSTLGANEAYSFVEWAATYQSPADL